MRRLSECVWKKCVRSVSSALLSGLFALGAAYAQTNTPPTVGLTAPANGASFTSPATIGLAATASDANGSVTRVQFYRGTTLLATDTTAPYSYSWTNVAPGTYSITARATDNQGAVTTSAPVSVTVVNTPPTVSLTSPTDAASFTSPATVALAATAADSNGTVASVRFYRGTTLLATDTTAPYSYSWTNVAPGTYSVTAQATDNLGAVTTSTPVNISVIAANTAPAVSLTAPASGASYTAPATVSITADATDSDGGIASVAFYNGTTLLGSDTTTPYSFNWTNVAAGTYSVTARATDNQGAVTTSTAVSVTVAAANIAPTVSLTAPSAEASFTAPASVVIAANSADADGTVTQVQFYNGTTLLGSDTTAPYSFNWTNVAAGTYSVTARATDNQGAVTTSAPVSVSVQALQSPPTVQITSPLQGAQYQGAPASVTVSAQATGGGGTVSRVEFYSGSQLILSDSSAPYTFTLTAQSLGNYSIYARVYNSLGQSADSEPVSFSVVNNLVPTVALSAPDPAGTYNAPANITLAAQASDSDGSIASVSFYNGSTLLATVQSAPYVFNWSGVPSGSYQLSARATDNAGGVGTSAALQITVSPAPGGTDPVVSISAPQSGASFVAPAVVDLSAQASASAGRTITSVAFFSGTQWLGTVTEAPYSYRWEDAPAGNHEIIARATDSAGVTASSASVLVTVSSSSNQPSVGITSPLAGAQYQGAPASVTVTAQATGGGGTVSRVEFYSGSNLILSDNRAPYTFTLTAQSLGQYSLYARVINSLGESVDSEPVSFSVVDNLRPTVQLVSPSAGSYHHAPASLSLQAQASDSDGIASVSFYNGSTLLGTVQSAPYVFNWTGVPVGNYQLSARATDNNGSVGQSAEVPVFVVVSPDTPRPTVSLNAPQAGANFKAPAIVGLAASAGATAGRTLVRVDFYSGSTRLGSASSAPYSLNWYNVPSGTYQVRAHAIDDIGAEGVSAPVSVVVALDDRPPSVSLTSPTVAQVHLAPASVTLNAQAFANQDRTLTSLTFFNGQTPIATLTQAPYSFVWENVAAGNYAVSVRATDSAGVQVDTPVRFVEVVGSDQAPTVRIVSPQSGERFVSAGRVPILLNASVGTSRAMRSLAVYSNGNRVATYSDVGEVGGVWLDAPSGTHVLTAQLVDDLGQVATSAPVEIVVSNTESAIRLDLQVDRSSASAYIQDPAGLINRVEFHRTHNGQQTVHLGTRYDDLSWRAFISSDVYAAPGEHRFVAVAFDAAGNELIRSAQRSYTVPVISSVELTEPAIGLELAGPANVSISGRVSLSPEVPASALSHVDVYLGNALAFSNVSLDSYGRFASQLTQLPLGIHDIRVRVVLNDGSFSEVLRRVRILDAADPYLLRISGPAEGAQVLVNSTIGTGYVVAVEGYEQQRSDWDAVLLEGRPDGFYSSNVGGPQIIGRENWVGMSLPGANESALYKSQSARVVGTTRQGAKRVSAWVNYTVYQRRIQFRYGQRSFQVRIPGYNSSTGVIEANDCTGCIAAVEVLRGEEVLQRQTQAPFYFNMYSLPIGVHTLTLRMIPVDPSRDVLNSGPVTVTVTGDNTPPAVNLTSPVNGATYASNTSITLSAQATDTGGSVSRVEFYQGDQLVGTRTVPTGNSYSTTYMLGWTPPANGQYVITARAVDSNGAVSVSSPAVIRVGQSSGDPQARESITYIHTDISGSPLVGTNAAGNVLWKENYSAFGTRQMQLPGTEGQRQWFHGKEVDAETGLQNFGARHYDVVLGRFISIDPVGFQEDNLHSFNRYAYGNNNPVRYLDPDGQQSMDVVYNVWNRAFNTNYMGFPADGARGFEIAKQGAIQGAKEGLILSAQVGLTVGTLGLGEGVVLATGAAKVATATRALSVEGKALLTAKPVGSALKADPAHRAATLMREEAAANGTNFAITGGDGVTRTLTQVPGGFNGVAGRYEYIVDNLNNLTHQMFVRGGSINGIPIKP